MALVSILTVSTVGTQILINHPELSVWSWILSFIRFSGSDLQRQHIFLSTLFCIILFACVELCLLWHLWKLRESGNKLKTLPEHENRYLQFGNRINSQEHCTLLYIIMLCAWERLSSLLMPSEVQRGSRDNPTWYHILFFFYAEQTVFSVQCY